MRSAVVAVLAVLAQVAAHGAPQAVNAHAALLADFDKRVTEYVNLHKKVESKMRKLKPKEPPEVVRAHEKKLVHELREARRKANQGDIFTPEIAQEFRRLIQLALQNDQKPVKESLARSEPVAIALGVNDPYPDGAPLQSMPPSLLMNLPKLPPELDYRIIGRALALRDVRANLIVDFVPNAIP